MFRVIWVSLLLAFTMQGLASTPEIVRFRHLTTDQGLSQSTVQCILKDRDGFMWFGTVDGLNRYDGYDFRVFRNSPRDPHSISGNSILTAHEDPSGNLWFGTESGLSRFDKKLDRFVNYGDESADIVRIGPESVEAICDGPDHRIWVGLQGLGLYLFDPSTGVTDLFAQSVEDTGSISSNLISTIFSDSRENLWVGTNDGGLNLFDSETKTFRRWLHDSADTTTIPGNDIRAIVEDKSGTIWVATYGGGLCRVRQSGNAWDFVPYQHKSRKGNALASDLILSLFVSKNGLWIGTENSGLDFFDVQRQSFTNFRDDPKNPESLNNNSIDSIWEDESGNLWVGTFSGGVNLANATSQAFRTYRSRPGDPSSLSYDSVLDFFESDDGSIWIATDGGGLDRLARESGIFEHFNTGNSNLPCDEVLEVLEDSNGDIWLGTWNGGLNKLNRETRQFETYTRENCGLPTNNVFAILEDSKKRFWINCFLEPGGLVLFNRKKGKPQKVYTTANSGIISADFQVIEEDRSGNLLIGSYQGLSIFDPERETFSNYTQESHKLSDNSVVSVLIGEPDIIWLGTLSGLNRFNRLTKGIKHYFVEDGLPSNAIKAMAKDAAGHIWIATNMGLARFDPELETFRTFEKADGLQGNEFNIGASFGSKDGRLWFGGVSGFNEFDPGSIRNNLVPPPVVLTDFQIFSKPVSIGEPGSPLKSHISQLETLTLSHRESVFAFSFAALDFVAPEKNQYAYIMDGFESAWNYVGSDRKATYTNLSPGEYTFRVKASNNHGMWNEEGHTLRIIIPPPFWMTWWFRLSAGATLLLAVVAVYKRRLHNIEAINHQLEKEVQTRTAELKHKNDELVAAQKELIDHAHKAGMADIATGILHNVGNVLNSVNTSADHLKTTLQKTEVANFKKANRLLREHLDNLVHFLTEDPKGGKLIDYYFKLESCLEEENTKMLTSVDRLQKNVDLIEQVIATQQQYAKAEFLTGTYSLHEIVEDSLALLVGAAQRHKIQIVKKFACKTPVSVQRTKLVQIIMNLFNNAKEEMRGLNEEDRVVTFETSSDTKHVYLSVSDTGRGVPRELRDRIFSYGFSTKEGGHGFGLHSCANHMTEMGGRIWLESEGEGQGATFVLSLPLAGKVKVISETKGRPERDAVKF